MKYYVATKINGNQFNLSEFDTLGQAYNFYIQDATNRMIVKEVKPEVTEK